ncbi:(2Fe-2S)-binding protein [Streptomyces xiaopingdaonensis]|uniref:(2Fe-2S)-binding protein n=1 Tax=Streptomyces xiaopingdaonensis TaxID=1565415 RepID=UPI0002D6FA07|nr:(2Fe-2S)-binding protein [Streptomyces xiaopingdaonensis]
MSTYAPPAPVAARLTPCTAAYTRLTEVLPAFRVTEVVAGAPLPDGQGWFSGEDLASGGAALDAYLAQEDAATLRDHGRQARPDVVATFGLHRYAWPACLLITLPWFLQRRVPRLPAGAFAYHRRTARLAVRAGEFTCLPDDPAASSPYARTADEEGLRAAVREAVAEHLGPVLDAFRRRVRRRDRALWGLATDEIVEGLTYLGGLLGEGERARRETAALLPGRTTPFAQGADFRTLTGPAGEALPTRTRASCCMYYTLEPADTCVTCPRTCDSERVERLASAG